MNGLKLDKKSLPQPVLDEHPEWIELYWAAWEKAFQNVVTPAKAKFKPMLTCFTSARNKIWQWDSCFMTFYARYSNGTLPGMNNLDNIYQMQRKDGYISMAYDLDKEQDAFGERINPPLLAWAEWEYFLVTGEDSRFSHVLPKLIKYYDWVRDNRRRENGLYWFEDTGSTGMDNSPRSGFEAKNLLGSDVCFIDLICQQALSASYIAKIAEYLGQKKEAKRFIAEFESLAELTNRHHWSERYGFYYDLFNRTYSRAKLNYINSKTIAAFWPILCDIASPLQVGRLADHILNPNEFWTLHPLPSLSKDDPNYNPQGIYWLGGVWAPTNYMVVKGLRKRGWSSLARDIAVRHLDAMSNVLRSSNYGSIWEAYSPDYFRPATKEHDQETLVRNDFVGWSALGPVSMLIENILGLSFDATENKVIWEINSPERHGVGNLQFNGNKLSFLAEKNVSTAPLRKLTIETGVPLKLEIMMSLGCGKKHSLSLRKGKHELVLETR